MDDKFLNKKKTEIKYMIEEMKSENYILMIHRYVTNLKKQDTVK